MISVAVNQSRTNLNANRSKNVENKNIAFGCKVVIPENAQKVFEREINTFHDMCSDKARTVWFGFGPANAKTIVNQFKEKLEESTKHIKGTIFFLMEDVDNNALKRLQHDEISSNEVSVPSKDAVKHLVESLSDKMIKDSGNNREDACIRVAKLDRQGAPYLPQTSPAPFYLNEKGEWFRPSVHHQIKVPDILPSEFQDIKGEPMSWAMYSVGNTLASMLKRKGKGSGVDNPFVDYYQKIGWRLDKDRLDNPRTNSF